jgi:F0F1-type ATP synthase membrane subunit c/vacuolar-type H+-ATPase subunit K
MKATITILSISSLLFLSSCSYCQIEPEECYKVDQIASIETLFESIARQPEAADQLIATAERVAGYSDIAELAPISPSISREFGYARGQCIGACAEALGRQPEMAETQMQLAVRLLGEAGSEEISDTVNAYSKVKALPLLLESIARQPEAFDLFNQLSITLLGVNLEDVDV